MMRRPSVFRPASDFLTALYERKGTTAGIFLPPSGREGDREAVEGAGGHSSRAKVIATGRYGIHPYGE